jgi:hypothetical protein
MESAVDGGLPSQHGTDAWKAVCIGEEKLRQAGLINFGRPPVYGMDTLTKLI